MVKKRRFNWVLSQVSKYLNLKAGKLPGPMMGIIVPTYKCNSNCPMCNLISKIDKGQEELDTSAMKIIIDEFHGINTSGISFTGGEPLLRDDIFELLEYSKRKDLPTTLCTNGILLNEKNVKRLLQIELDNINISIDASNREAFSKIRGVKPEVFDSVINSIKNLSNLKKAKNKRTTITVVVVVSKDNISDIKNIVRLAAKIGANKIGFMPLHDFDNDVISCKSDILIDVNELIFEARRVNIKIDNTKKYLDTFNIAFGGGKFPNRCYAHSTSLIVDCYRNFYPCWPLLELGHRIENTRSKSLNEIWHSKKYNKVREGMKNCRDCFWNCHAEMSVFFNYL
jgi:MoaA/NifB/PqqE/SkfB family radical SAM enzyme